MNSKELENSYQKNKNQFFDYVKKIKINMKVDIFSLINTTLISNPYTTKFPNMFFKATVTKEKLLTIFFKSSVKFYARQTLFLSQYLLALLIFKLFYKKKDFDENGAIHIDIFLLINTIIKENAFIERYFSSLYPTLDKRSQKYVFLVRLYGSRNPFKILNLVQVLNKDSRQFIFEFDLLTLKDIFELIYFITAYPFKTLRLFHKERSPIDRLFNQELIKDIGNQSFESFTRFIFGKNIAKINTINTIYSWSEFQVVERSFNYGIRSSNSKIKLIGCQLYINYETYFNTFVDDLDFKQETSPHVVLVNGKYNILEREQVKYKLGVSLRYERLFVNENRKFGNNILVLGSLIENDTKYVLDCIPIAQKVLFKSHPALELSRLGRLNSNIQVVDDDIYKLFEDTMIVFGTASGSLLEAVVSGISVIVIASQDNLTANPLVSYGQGEIWDIAFSKDEVETLYNKLLAFRKNNTETLASISKWYKENFFIEPTEENIVKAFELDTRVIK